MYKANLTYFKESGKYYSASELNLLPEELTSDKNKVVLLYDIVNRIKELSKKKKLPGLSTDWLGQQNQTILITFPDELSGCPQLIQAN